MAGSFSPSSSSARRWTYDIFLNFRGEDTRRSFVGHLYKALNQKALNTFIDSVEVGKGNHLSVLLEAIQESRLSVLVFSQNYASSTWCLKELVQIMQCLDHDKMIVVPIFYEVDPSDIRKQTGNFEKHFVRHELNPNIDAQEVRSWRSALTRATNLSGWDSATYQDDVKLIEDIVEDIFKQLMHVSASKTDDLVGMDSHLNVLEPLLCTSIVNDVRIVGIWGMGGIGKSTIAKAVYDKIKIDFEHYCFLDNVKEGFLTKNGAVHMKVELLSRILKVEVRHILDRGSDMIRERLGKKKVLLVLDDVDSIDQIETVIGKKPSFGSGSRIIITTRDKHLLGGFLIYEPKALSFDIALDLFRQYAFRTNECSVEYNHLSNCAVKYAQGLPLALKVLGALLDNKSVSEWEDELEKIKKIPDRGIEGVLKTSIYGLDESQKNIFLDIACFFRGKKKDYVTQVLHNCGFHPRSGLRVLIDRALITISHSEKLEMHDLLQEIGWEMGKLSRLRSYEHVERVLNQNTGTEAVEGIILELKKSEELYFNADAFVSMKKLRLLKIHQNNFYAIHGLHDDGCEQEVGGDLKFLSQELRLLEWHGCPLKFLPSDFRPKNLTNLLMPFSRIEGLWEGIKPLKNLENIDLSHSQYLTRIPDLTYATNLKLLDVRGCVSLMEVRSSTLSLKKLVYLILSGCKELQILPISIHMKSLQFLDLSGCSKLEKFPEISGVMNQLQKLYLDGTAIKELPASVELLVGLIILRMRNCRSLVCLPDEICYLTRLEKLYLAGCSKLLTLPENLGNLESLEKLELDGSGINQIPFSLRHLSKETLLSCKGCKHMTDPFSSWPTWIQENCSYSGLVHLDLSDCNLVELSDRIAHLSSLETLKLCRNDLESLPSTMSQLCRLTDLKVEACKRLKSIPELASSIEWLYAHDCKALETVSRLKPGYKENFCFTFTNCFQLVQSHLFTDILEADSFHQYIEVHDLLRSMPLPERENEIPYWFPDHHLLTFSVTLPGSQIPHLLDYQVQCRGSSVTVQLPPDWGFDKYLGFAICAVSNSNSLPFASCDCTLKGDHGQFSFDFPMLQRGYKPVELDDLDHIILACKTGFIGKGKGDDEFNYTHATFRIRVREFSLHEDEDSSSCITSCGVGFFPVINTSGGKRETEIKKVRPEISKRKR